MKSIRTAAAACTLALIAAGEGAAQTGAGPESFANPPVLAASEVVVRGAGVPDEEHYRLSITMLERELRNPATGSFDRVSLRGYLDETGRLRPALVAPTIEVMPGQTIRLSLVNRLTMQRGEPHYEDNVGSCYPGDVPRDPNVPHCFNGTNMHTHGLWISPSGNSDNVLIKINPGVAFQYEYNIPPDHPSGTFWYHPHLHGSTALQVGSGMAGALIIRGNRAPTLQRPGDLDTLLAGFDEALLVMQQIPYACFDSAGTVQKNTDGTWRCERGQVGIVQDYRQQFGQTAWRDSGRYTAINGTIIPNFAVKQAGALQRWRMIHAGVRDTISVEFRKLTVPGASVEGLRADQHDDWIERNCGGDPLTYHLVASDGLTTPTALATAGAVMQPGYRWDALVAFPEPGLYCVVDGSTGAAASINATPPSRQLLATAVVAGGAPVTASITEQLKAAAGVYDRWVATKVRGELDDGLRLTSFAPHRTLLTEPRTAFGTQELMFDIGGNGFSVSNRIGVIGEPFQPGKVSRHLILGKQDEWTLTSNNAGHPFHIHVNPFQIVGIYGPDDPNNRNDLSQVGAVDPVDGDRQFAGMHGMWKDSLFVKSGIRDNNNPIRFYRMIVRSRYERYIGKFVLHCHILDHEDKGMMQEIEIVMPDGRGGLAMSGHGQH